MRATSTKSNLSDKDLQLLKRTYIKLTELYYESPKSESAITDLVNFSTLLTQAVGIKRDCDQLSLTAFIEILKLKSKNSPPLLASAAGTLQHLKNPQQKAFTYPAVLYALQRSELFVAGCTIAIRNYERLGGGEFDWKEILNELSRNISVSPSLCLQLVYQVCRENQSLSRAAVKSGLVKYVFLSHIAKTLDDKYNLYKSIKLLKVVSKAERTLLKDREKSLALIIYTYEDYIPVVEEICARCYDQEYALEIDNKRRYDQSTIDQPYLWSYTEAYVTRALSEQTVGELIKALQGGLPEDRETKTYAILANYSKFKKGVRKEALQTLPRSQKALLNFIKLCVGSCESDPNSLAAVDLGKLQQLVDKSQSPKAGQLFKYLKQIRSREKGGVGVLSENVKKLFDMEKNADFLMERASKIPMNTQQLGDIKQILKQKDRTNEFQSDTLKTVKDRAATSLQTAILQRRKLDLSSILKEVQLTDVRLVAKLLQTLQLNLTMNQQLTELVPVGRVLELIQWIEQHFAGESIQWSSIRQLLAILVGPEQWRKQLQILPQQAFWLMTAESVEGQDQQDLFAKLEEIRANLGKYEGKLHLILGFLGLTLSREQKALLLQRFPQLFQALLKGLQGTGYKAVLIMLGTFLKGWHSDSSQLNKIFSEFISKLVSVILANFRSLDQEYEVLENCLPYKIPVERLTDGLETLVSQHGRLASYVYRENLNKGSKLTVPYDRIRAVGRLPLEKSKQIIEILNFLEQNGELLQQDEFSPLLQTLTGRKMAYWLMYPNFFNILSRAIAVLSKASSPLFSKITSGLLFKFLAALNVNPDLSQDQRRDLLGELLECIRKLGQRGTVLDKDRLRRGVERVKENDIKIAMNELIDTLKEPPQQQEDTQPQGETKPQPIQPEGNTHTPQQKREENPNPSQLEDLERRDEPFNIDKHFQSTKETSGTDAGLMQALRDLKKIIEKELPETIFPKLNDVFLTHPFREQHKDMLGYLLVKFYPNRPESLKALARQLISRKEKTYLSKQTCYQLLSKNKQAFILARRWKLTGREWLDLAMERMMEGFYGIGSQIAEYNLPRTADLQYFFGKKMHEIVLSSFGKVTEGDDLAQYLVLVGTSARFPQIKKAYIREKLHTKVLQGISKFPQNLKLIGNLSYALSALAYVQPDVCLQVVRQKIEMGVLLGKYASHWDNRAIVESGACLVANLAYSNEEVKEQLRQLGCSQVFLGIFQKLLQNPEISTFKQILRALGNLSLSAKFAQEMIDGHFCSLAVRMMQKLSIFQQLDQKKAALMKILIDLVANLASHRHRLDIFHKQRLTVAILTMLENTQDHPPILTACIDTIDCLCQNPQIQSYVVTEKRILYLLVEVLKVQTEEKIVVKSTRLLTNLTINPTCIPYILEANLLSVLASIVMPHFYGNKLAAEQKKKMETYILKIITRIYHSKQSKELILRSGYLDCLLTTIETSDVIEDAYIEILYAYSENLPSFLNKRAFLCLLRIIAKKIVNKQAVGRCFRIIKTLSNLYERDEEDILLDEAPQMYEKLLSNNDFKEQGLFLLAYHLLRSNKLRTLLQKKTDRVLQIVKQSVQDSKLSDLCRQVAFIAYNPYSLLPAGEALEVASAFQLLRSGFKCNLFRMDGSSKKAVLDISQEYQLRAYKFPGGEIKRKYVIDIKNLKDFQFSFPVSEELWNSTVFMMEKGLFDNRKVPAQCCCSLIGSAKWGELSFINVELESEEEKIKLMRCIGLVFHSVR